MSDNSDSDNSELSVKEATRALKKLVSRSETYYYKTPESIFVMLGKIYPTGNYDDNDNTYWFSVKVCTVEITWFKA